jgi:Zn-dependent protease
MQGWSINLFRIRGIRIAVDITFLVPLAYVAYQGWTAGGREGLEWGIGLFLLCFTCIVLHELGHSLTAMHYGVKIRRIVLMIFGGKAEFDRIPRKPIQEFLITAAGPLVNFVIAGVLWALLGLPADWSYANAGNTLLDVGRVLIIWNLVVGCFNLIPAFPMDGGRIVRSLLATRMPYLRATFWAASIAKVVTVVGAIIAFYRGDYYLGFLFLFIFRVGDLEYRAVRRQEQEDALWRASLIQNVTIRPPAEPPILSP